MAQFLFLDRSIFFDLPHCISLETGENASFVQYLAGIEKNAG